MKLVAQKKLGIELQSYRPQRPNTAIPASRGVSGSLTGCAQSMAMASLRTPTSRGEHFQPDLDRE